MPDTYTVSVFPVRKSGFESNSRSRMPTWWQFVIPTSSIPMRIASSDAAGTPTEERLDTPNKVEVVEEQLGPSPRWGSHHRIRESRCGSRLCPG